MDRHLARFAFLFIALVTCLAANAATTSAGRTAGRFGVSSNGSAQYTIPIWTPPGIHGLQPSVSLTYDSQSSYGLMGPGWQLTGLSTIARCNLTVAQDGTPGAIALTTADRLCLDGARLRLTSSETLSNYWNASSTYQTEIANFSQVTASSTLAGTSPSYFTVQRKDGLTYEYGRTADSQVLVPGNANPYVWALDKVTDRAGNTMTYTYTQANGAYVIASIQYTAPSGSSTYPYQVTFKSTSLQSPNPNILTKSVAGYLIQQSNQLSTITVTSSGNIVREYNLNYTISSATSRATLTSIQECGGSGGTDCLAATYTATTVGYQYGTAGAASPTTATGSGATNGFALYSVDIDGDGKKDLVYAVTSGSNYEWWVQLATATGYGTPINTGAVTAGKADFLLDDFDAVGGTEILAPVSGIWYVYKLSGSSFTATSTGVSVNSSGLYASADVDGDGRPDIVYVIASTMTIYVQLNTSSGGTFSFAAPVSSALPVGSGNYTALFGNNSLSNSPITHFDFDGDGREDLILSTGNSGGHGTAYHYVYGLLSRGTAPFLVGPTAYANTTGAVPSIAAVRWNDDACTDLITDQTVAISECNGNYGSSLSLPATPTLFMDWDGDGRTDALANVSGTWQLYQSEGNAVASAVSTGISVGTGIWAVTDKDGDGLDDLVSSNASGNALEYGLHNAAGQHPDLATSFVDEYGNSSSPSYISLAQANGTYYSSFHDAVFPYQDYFGTMYVVRQVNFSDPTNPPNGTYNLQYYYAGGWINLQGRGFSGIRNLEQSDSRNGLWEQWAHEREFPYTGILMSDIRSQDNVGSIPISNYESTALATVSLDNTANNQRVFPYVPSSTNQIYEMQVGNDNGNGAMNGTLITSSSTSYNYDSYGNQTNTATTVTDKDSGSPYYNDTWTSTVATTYTPTTSSWCLNMPTERYVENSSSAPNGTAITRTVSYTPDYTYCRETQQVVEPSSSTYKVTTAYGYDGFGNLNSQTVTGVGMTARVTGINWGTSGQFPTTVTNALSQTTTFAFDANSGMPTSVTDPNGITTTWQYDDFARKTKELRSDGTSTVWTYTLCSGCDARPRLVVTEQPKDTSGHVITTSTSYFDMLDRQIYTLSTLLDGTSAWNQRFFDSLGRVSSKEFPFRSGSSAVGVETYTYDGLNRVTQVQRPISATNGTLQTTRYGYAGRTSTVTDALNNVSTRISLVTGGQAQITDAAGYYIKFSYDAFGSVKSVTDKASNTLFTANYVYGITPFQTSAVDMDLGAWSYTFDALGENTGYTDAKSVKFSMTYDALSRPLVRTDYVASPDLTTTWTWGNTKSSYNIGKLQSVTAAGSVGSFIESYTYDSNGRLATDTQQLPGDATYVFTYSYSPTTGCLNTLKYPVSTSGYQLALQYGYSNGILSSVTDTQSGAVYWTANATNSRGQITQETLGNGAVTNRAYDAITGWLGSIQSGAGSGSALQNNAFLYDYLGDVTQRQDNNKSLTENFYYDADLRLDHSTLGGRSICS